MGAQEHVCINICIYTHTYIYIYTCIISICEVSGLQQEDSGSRAKLSTQLELVRPLQYPKTLKPKTLDPETDPNPETLNPVRLTLSPKAWVASGLGVQESLPPNYQER